MKAFRGFALSVVLLIAAIYPVQAQQQTETFMRLPANTVIKHQEGTQRQVARATTGDREGKSCQVTAVATNNSSIHPGSSLRVNTGNDSMTLDSVERDALVTTTGEQTMTLGRDMTVAVTIGADEEFSAGLEISLNCETPEPTCKYNEALSQSDPKCFEPCKHNSSIAADDEDCKKPKPPVAANNGNQQPQPPAPTQSETPRPVAGKGSDLPNTGPTSTTLLALSLGFATYSLSLYRQQRKTAKTLS